MQNSSLRRNGPFPNHIDPWAERGRYFHQLHWQMIGYLLDELTDTLENLGYIVGRESSIQITTAQPDIFISEAYPHNPKNHLYPQAVAALELETGLQLAQAELELDRLFIQSLETGDLVTVVEIVSPNNKIKQKDIEAYQKRRFELAIKSVNIVEIDLTRSRQRLLDNPITENYPYHIVVYPYDEAPYFIGLAQYAPLKTFALPLRNEAYPVNLNAIYRQAYSRLLLAAQIDKAGEYQIESLPYPSFFNENERQKLLDNVQAWQAAMKA